MTESRIPKNGQNPFKNNDSPVKIIQMNEAPLEVLQEEIGKIVELELEQSNNERVLKEETKKTDDLISTGIEFTKSDLDERQNLIDNSKNPEVEFVYSGLIDSGKNTIEQYIKVFLLGAIENRGSQLNLILEENTKKQVDSGKFDTFNPVSFGPGAPMNQPNFVKKLEDLDFKIEEEKGLKTQVDDLQAKKNANETVLGTLKSEIAYLKTETELELAKKQELEDKKAEFKTEIEEYETEFTQLEAQLKMLEERNETLVATL